MANSLCRIKRKLVTIVKLSSVVKDDVLRELQGKAARLDKKSSHPFPAPFHRLVWDLCLEGTTSWELQKVHKLHKRPMGPTLTLLRRGFRYQFTWKYNEDGDRIWIEFNPRQLTK